MTSIRDTPFLLSLVILCFAFIIPSNTTAQSFEEGLKYYQQKDYKQAFSVFNQVTSPEGYLFSGKSLYALRQYQQARSTLNNIPDNAAPSIYYEALYTSALINFQQKNFADALNELYEVSRTDLDRNLNFSADDLYRQILEYLTGNQRLEIMEDIEADKVKFDLLKSALGKISFDQARQLQDAFQNEVDDDEWSEKADEFEASLDSRSGYQEEYGEPANQLQPPDGTIYTLAFALPEYQPSDQEFEIVKALYFGAVLAVDEFNDENNRVKAYLRFSDTGRSTGGLRPMAERFIEDNYGDAIIGPLFSDQADAMAPVITDLRIPAIAPLANKDLNIQNSFLFQANPPFQIHGREMARYAVQQLGLQNFGIIAQRSSNGAASAEAFRDEAETLGAKITHYFIEDLQSNEYEINNYTRYFGSSTPPIEAVYAPLTGQRSLTLIDLLLANIQGMNSPVTVLGSQEYHNLNFRTTKYRNLDIHFSEGTYQRNSGQLAQFKSRYKSKFNTTGNQYSMIGYDVTRFILDALREAGNPAMLRSAIADHPKYRGLVKDIQFDGGNINKALKILHVTPTGEVRVQN